MEFLGLKEASAPRNLGDLDDDRLEALLMWVKNFYVHKIPGTTCVCYQQDVYYINAHTVKQSPEWEATIAVYSVWEQENQRIIFRLADK